MNIATYETLRHFADSWGLVYMMGIFLAVAFMIIRPGARNKAADAAQIPFRDETDPK
jgi:cytochrome c oxidase cbb3-type subunit 4